jgi:hypothetical protein
MDTPIRIFAVALFRKWWALMSCAAFTVLGIYAAATNKGNLWVVSGSGVLANLFVFVAAYQTWREEHDKYTAEVSKNLRPDIRGEVGVCGYGMEGEGHENGHWSVDSEVVFQLSLCNHRPVTTTLEGIECDGSQLTPPVLFEPSLVSSTGSFPVGTEMPHGIGKTIDVAIAATIDGVRWQDVHPIDLKPLKFYVIDAFGQRHLLQIKRGDRLFASRP